MSIIRCILLVIFAVRGLTIRRIIICEEESHGTSQYFFRHAFLLLFVFLFSSLVDDAIHS